MKASGSAMSTAIGCWRGQGYSQSRVVSAGVLLSRVWRYENVDVQGGLVAAPVDVGTAGVVLGDGAFDDAGSDPEAPVGHQVGQHAAADRADEVDDGLGDDAGGLHELVTGGVEVDGEAAPV